MFDNTQEKRLFQPLTLPGGQVIPNRIAKASMEENMADDRHLPGKALLGLYRQWGAGGTRLILTGNVMVAANAVTGPGGVVLDDRQPLAPFQDWARAAKAQGARIWMQINHPGRQVFARPTPRRSRPRRCRSRWGAIPACSPNPGP